MRWMIALEFGLSRRRLRSRKVTCAVEAERVRSRSNSTSTSSAPRGDQRGWSGRPALDAALGVGDHRLGRPVALGDRDRQRLVGELGGEAGVAHHLGPGAEAALLDGGVAVLDGAADLLGREDARALGGRLLDGDERDGERFVGGGHLDDGDEQLGSGPQVGRRPHAAQLEDLRPEVGVLQVALGHAANRVARLEDDRLKRALDGCCQRSAPRGEDDDHRPAAPRQSRLRLAAMPNPAPPGENI